MTKRMLAAAVLLALALVAVLLAADVRSWHAAIEDGDAVYASSPRDARWVPPTTFGGVAASLLGTSDDVSFRRALQQYRVASATHETLDNATQVQTARARAQDALTAAAAGFDARRSSQARTLLGVLTFGSSATGAEQNQVESAVADFTDAIRTDPTNVDAKFDLELQLRLSTARGTRAGQGVGGGFGRGARRGGGGGSPGKGY